MEKLFRTEKLCGIFRFFHSFHSIPLSIRIGATHDATTRSFPASIRSADSSQLVITRALRNAVAQRVVARVQPLFSSCTWILDTSTNVHRYVRISLHTPRRNIIISPPILSDPSLLVHALHAPAYHRLSVFLFLFFQPLPRFFPTIATPPPPPIVE